MTENGSGRNDRSGRRVIPPLIVEFLDQALCRDVADEIFKYVLEQPQRVVRAYRRVVREIEENYGVVKYNGFRKSVTRCKKCYAVVHVRLVEDILKFRAGYDFPHYRGCEEYKDPKGLISWIPRFYFTENSVRVYRERKLVLECPKNEDES